MNTITIRLTGRRAGGGRRAAAAAAGAAGRGGGGGGRGRAGGWAEAARGSQQRTGVVIALLAAFDAAGFTYLDGTAIPTAAWAGWIPSNVHPPAAQWKQSFNMQIDLNPAVGTQTTVTVHREYRYETIPFSWDWGAPNPGNRPDQLDVLRNTLPQGAVPPSGKHLYDPAYPWPLYERYGFTDIDDMVDHLDWVITYSNGTLHFRATRYEYTVMLPITDPPAPPANPVLRLYNFFPSNAAAGPAVLN